MEEVAEKINEFVLGYESNESIGAMLRNSVNEQAREKPCPENYYYLTDLCNPCETYWKIIRPDIKRPLVLLRKLLKGKELHKRSSYWLSNLQDFTVYEGKLDGIHVKIPGVRGAIDYLLGNRILDLKTKNKIPITAEEVLSSFPQDVEQVAFYSIIHPSNPRENYLLFMQDSDPFKLMAFKVIIKDLGRIKSLILDRMKKLDFALENHNPSQLGRSRYHHNKCYLCEANLCNCEELTPLSTESLKLAVEVIYDEEFTKSLTDLKDKSKFSSSIFSIWNVIAPLEHYKETVLGVESDYANEEKEEYLLCLRNLVDQLPFKVGLTDKESIKKCFKEPRLYLGFRWLKIATSGNPEGSLVPYIIKVSNTSDRRNITKPNPYHMAQLGVAVAAYGKSKGIIFTVYPKINDSIQVFEVTYQKPNELLGYISNTLNLLEKSIQEKNPSILPPNPPFIKSDLQTQLKIEPMPEISS